MRVVHIVRQFAPAIGGLENFVLELVQAQRRAGIEAEVVTLDRIFRHSDRALPAREIVNGIPVRRIPFRGSSRYPIAPTVLRHLAGFDLVHVHAVDFFCDYLAATAIAHRRPMVLSTHGGFFHTESNARLKRLYFQRITRSSLRNYRLVFASSPSDETLFRTIAPDRTVCIENGVNTHKFSCCSSPDFTPALIFVGRLSINKAIGDLLAAFEIAKASEPDARLHIVGNDSDFTGQQLRSEIAALKLCDSILVHQNLDDDGVRRLMADCSLFVSASRYEGFGIALVEALSAGLLPVVNRIPSFAVILERAQVGRLCNYSCTTEAAQTLVEAIRHHRQHFAAQRAAAIRAAEHYDWTLVVERFADHYRRVLGITCRPLLGVDVAVLDESRAAAKVAHAIDAGPPLNVAFANANTLNIAARDIDYRKALRDFLVLNDGIGVDIASRIKFGKPFAANLNGTDFVPHLLDTMDRPLRVAVLGSTVENITVAARYLADRWPRHTFLAVHDGYFDGDDDASDYCRQVHSQSVDILLVGMGNPVQEKWIARNGPATGAKVLIGVGALFDFASGRVRRAPRWVRSLRCEWCYRLALEPRRLARRYLIGNPLFLFRAFRDRLRAGIQ